MVLTTNLSNPPAAASEAEPADVVTFSSPEPNPTESLLLDAAQEAARRAIVRVLAEKLAENNVDVDFGCSSLSTKALRLDVLIGRFPSLSKDELLREAKAVRDAREEEEEEKKRKAAEDGTAGGTDPPKKKRGRPKKIRTTEQDGAFGEEKRVTIADLAARAKEPEEPAPPKKKRGRPKKDETATTDESEPPKRKRGRPRKSETATDAATESTPPPPKKKRGRPRKVPQTDEELFKDMYPVTKPPPKTPAERELAKLRKKEEKERKKAEIRRKWQETNDANFETMLEALKEYKAEHGHVNVPARKNDPLAAFVTNQRKEYKWLKDGWSGIPSGRKRERKPYLTAERLQRLTDIGFQFCLLKAGKQYTFEERLDQIRQAKEELGLGESFMVDDIPKAKDRAEAEPGQDPYKGLRKWLKIQVDERRWHLQGKQRTKTSFSPERVEILEGLGFVFPTTLKPDRNWEKRYQDLLDYAREHGDCLVPKVHPGGLGLWVLTQRRNYAKMLTEKCGGDEEEVFATSDKMRRLRDVGFVFSCRTRRWRRKPVDWEEP